MFVVTYSPPEAMLFFTRNVRKWLLKTHNQIAPKLCPSIFIKEPEVRGKCLSVVDITLVVKGCPRGVMVKTKDFGIVYASSNSSHAITFTFVQIPLGKV